MPHCVQSRKVNPQLGPSCTEHKKGNRINSAPRLTAKPVIILNHWNKYPNLNMLHLIKKINVSCDHSEVNFVTRNNPGLRLPDILWSWPNDCWSWPKTLDQPTVGLDQTTVALDQTTIGLDQTPVAPNQPYVALEHTTVALDQLTVGLDQTSVGLYQTTVGPFALLFALKGLAWSFSDIYKLFVKTQIQPTTKLNWIWG